MSKFIRTTLLCTVVLTSTTACTYIKSLFPDKEKDYQYTAELPPLIIPDDLKQSSAPSIKADTVAKSEPTAAPQTRTQAVINPVPAETVTQNETPVYSAPVQTDTNNEAPEKLSITDKQNEVEINAPIGRSYRLVNKALTLKVIEVIERNQQTNNFKVHFDPNEQKPADDSYWGKFTSYFDSLDFSQDIYLVKLQEVDQKTTRILIADQQEKTLSDSNSTLLLNTIKAGLKEELTEQ